MSIIIVSLQYLMLFQNYWKMLIEFENDADEYQFGFKKGFSRGLCTYAFKQTVHYYRQCGSHLFCCFIDFSKAFDNVDYWLLFCKLLGYNKSKACFVTVKLLAYWYSH